MNHSFEVIGALQTKISVEEHLPLAYAAILAENALYRFDERVQTGVIQWASGELQDSFTVGDISLADIQYEIGVSLFQALCVMDIYLKNPEYIPTVLWGEEEEITDVDMSVLIDVEDLSDDE